MKWLKWTENGSKVLALCGPTHIPGTETLWLPSAHFLCHSELSATAQMCRAPCIRKRNMGRETIKNRMLAAIHSNSQQFIADYQYFEIWGWKRVVERVQVERFESYWSPLGLHWDSIGTPLDTVLNEVIVVAGLSFISERLMATSRRVFAAWHWSTP